MPKLQKTQQNNLNNIDTEPESCYTCKAWRVFEGLQEVSELVGECRLNPPVLTYDDESEPTFLWPCTSMDGWCAKWIGKNQYKALS